LPSAIASEPNKPSRKKKRSGALSERLRKSRFFDRRMERIRI
jgi:hypothetical protein